MAGASIIIKKIGLLYRHSHQGGETLADCAIKIKTGIKVLNVAGLQKKY